jgi:type III pantothenate kinase
MNLVVDIGNTNIKIGVFDQGQMILKGSIEAFNFESLSRILVKHPKVVRAIVSSVREIEKVERVGIEIHYLDHTTVVPFNNNYTTSDTLGLDRVSLVSAAALKYPNKDCLVIDAGTCITYDFIDKTGTYWGGAISPGVHMRLKSMHHFTSKLPDLKLRKVDKLIGNSTESSMMIGAVEGTRREVLKTIEDYKSRYPDMLTIITGGDLEIFANLSKNGIFASPNFLIEGLNYILEHNA